MSKTIWASVVSGLLSLTGAGMTMTEIQLEEISMALVNLSAVISTGIAIYGRVTAESKIG
jgi:hypothetical protein